MIHLDWAQVGPELGQLHEQVIQNPCHLQELYQQSSTLYLRVVEGGEACQCPQPQITSYTYTRTSQLTVIASKKECVPTGHLSEYVLEKTYYSI